MVRLHSSVPPASTEPRRCFPKADLHAPRGRDVDHLAREPQAKMAVPLDCMKAIQTSVVFLVLAIAALAEEAITINGVTYENVRWGRVTGTTVEMFHKTGVATIPIRNLPPELQQRFGYVAPRAPHQQGGQAGTRTPAVATQAEDQRKEAPAAPPHMQVESPARPNQRSVTNAVKPKRCPFCGEPLPADYGPEIGCPSCGYYAGEKKSVSAQDRPQTTRIVKKVCGKCGKEVSLSAHALERCPHCGVLWAKETGGQDVGTVIMVIIVLSVIGFVLDAMKSKGRLDR